MKQIILKSVGMIILFLVAFTSCKKEESEVSNSINYTEMAVYELQSDCALGKMGCFELVFPVTIQFADNSTLTANSYDELKAGIKAWREANGKDAVRPQFVFPISVINEAGETIVVENQDQLKELRAACPDAKRHGPKGHFERGLNCFDLV